MHLQMSFLIKQENNNLDVMCQRISKSWHEDRGGENTARKLDPACQGMLSGPSAGSSLGRSASLTTPGAQWGWGGATDGLHFLEGLAVAAPSGCH